MKLQVCVFASSFLVTFSSLFGAAWLIKVKLRDAGYDISRLILLGIDSTPAHRTVATMDSFTQFVVLALAFASSAFLYFKFAPAKRKPVLDPKVFQEFALKEKIQVSPNTAIYRFALPRSDDHLGLPIGQHISISAEINGKEVQRSYTPTSNDDVLGSFDLLIKSYEKGNISRHVSTLNIGDKVKFRGPKGFFMYTPTLAREIGMIAGGTGITPMLQIIRAALKNPADKTRFQLIYANVNQEDILLKKELDSCASLHPTRFSVFYVLNNPPEGWTGGVGFVSKEQIKEYLPASSSDIKILLCGPPPMMVAMKKHLAELDYPAPRSVSKVEDQVFVF